MTSSNVERAMDDVVVMVGEPDRGLTFDRPFALHPGHVESVRVRIVADGLQGEYRVTVPGLATFFASLAGEWRGWDGVRTFTADYYDSPRLALSCTHDRVGHVSVLIDLGDLQHPSPAGWAVRATVVAEPGALRLIAEGLSQLLAEPIPSE